MASFSVRFLGCKVSQTDAQVLRERLVRDGHSEVEGGGDVAVVNVWASWCVPCRDEHPLLVALSKRSDIKLFGINNKDEPENARRFLTTLGQPFAAIGADRDGRTSIDWGVYGVPETFIIDGAGMIRYKWIGPLTPEALAGTFSSEIEKAKLPPASAGN